MAGSPHHQPCPGAKTGFVFICPGRFEAARGYPCAAGTGANLARALIELHARRPDLFPSPLRDKYVITNSWKNIEYPALSGRSVPTESEVLDPGNLDRLRREIGALATVVACGAQAQAAVRALSTSGVISAHIAFGRHLSQRAVNMIPGGADTPSRIRLWCDALLTQLGDPD
jgi:hypothetical protein